LLKAFALEKAAVKHGRSKEQTIGARVPTLRMNLYGDA